MKNLLLLSLLSVSVCTSGCAQVQQSSTAYNPQDLQVKWALQDNHYRGKAQALQSLTLINTGTKPFPAVGWKLYYNGSPSLQVQDEKGRVKQQHINGDLFQLSPSDNFPAIPAGDSLRLDFVAGSPVENTSRYPEGLYLVWDKAPDKGMPVGKISYLYPDRAKNADLWVPAEVTYHQNETIQDIPQRQLTKIFPTPAQYQETGDSLQLTAAMPVVAPEAFKAEAALLAAYLETVFGQQPAVVSSAKGKAIQLVKKAGMGPEAYELQVSKAGVVLAATTPAGVYYGMQSLKTLLPPAALATKQPAVTLPGVAVVDAPRFGHRAFMMDVARNFHSKAEVLKVLDLMSLYKLNVLHFHLNDDEGWRLEIPDLPELTAVGGTRGHTPDNKKNLQPSYGSGAATDNTAGTGYYSKADYIDILKYANARHIRVIPEIETPGHARAAIKAMDARYERLMQEGKKAEAERYMLRDVNDKSEYQSVQNWDDNVINVALPSTYTFLSKVVDEMLQMYKEAGAPLETVHFGGDEVPAGVWQKSPAVQALIRSNPSVDSTSDLWYYYFGKVNDLLQKRNLYLSGWEEIGLKKVKENGRMTYEPNPDFADKNFHVDVWNNVGNNQDLAYKMANAGYKVVLTNVTNLYLDLAYKKDYDEAGANWGGYLDVDKPYYFMPFDYLKNAKKDQWGNPVFSTASAGNVRLTDKGKSNIVGLQAPLWSERVENQERLEYMLLPKLLGLAERAWAPAPVWAGTTDVAQQQAQYEKGWSQFVNVLGKRELPRLDYYAGGFGYRIPTPGAVVQDGKVYANVQLPGLQIRYTTDGSEPTANSKLYQGPFTPSGTVRLRAFTAGGRGGHTAVVQPK